jgi:hypothetical protein
MPLSILSKTMLITFCIILCSLPILPPLLIILAFPNPPFTLPYLTPFALLLKKHFPPITPWFDHGAKIYKTIKPFTCAPVFSAFFLRGWRLEENWCGNMWLWSYMVLDGVKEVVLDVVELWQGGAKSKGVWWTTLELVIMLGVCGAEAMGWWWLDWIIEAGERRKKKDERVVELAERGEKEAGFGKVKGEKEANIGNRGEKERGEKAADAGNWGR